MDPDLSLTELCRQAGTTAHQYLYYCKNSICELYDDNEAHLKYPDVLIAMMKIANDDFKTMLAHQKSGDF